MRAAGAARRVRAPRRAAPGSGSCGSPASRAATPGTAARRAYNPRPAARAGAVASPGAPGARRCTSHEARSLAVRLQLKLGAVTEQDRLPDSPDTVVVVEPSVGSVGRTKGNLYLLVTSRVPGSRAREATRLVADTIRNEYYYDESAGIRQCLTKVLGVANKRLAHQRDRYGLGHQARRRRARSAWRWPWSAAASCTSPRSARPRPTSSARPACPRCPTRTGSAACPTDELEPEVWRGELAGRRLAVPRLGQRRWPGSGRTPSRTRWSRSTRSRPIEHLHARFVAADGQGSDGAFAFEATRGRRHVQGADAGPGAPGRAARRRAGQGPRSRSRTPSTAGAAAVGAGATRARDAAGNGFQRFVWRIQDLLPQPQARRRARSRAASTPHGDPAPGGRRPPRLRRRGRRRSASASTPSAGSRARPRRPSESLTAAQQAFEAAQEALDERHRARRRPHRRTTRKQALELLPTAYQRARQGRAGRLPGRRRSRRSAPQISAGLDRLYGVVHVASTDRVHVPGRAGPSTLDGPRPRQRRRPVRARHAAPRRSGASTSPRRRPRPICRVRPEGVRHARSRDPKFITTGGPDVLILDTKNVLWRWRPLGTDGQGDAGQDQRRGLDHLGQRHPGDRHVRGQLRRRRSTSSTSSTRPSRTSWSCRPPATGRATRRPPRARLPARPPGGRRSPTCCIDGDIYVAENGARRARDPDQRLEAGAAARHAAPARRRTTRCSSSPDLPDGSYEPSAHGHALRLRRARTTGSSRSTRPTASTWRSTCWPAATRAGPTSRA